MWALVEASVVNEVTSIDPQGRFPEGVTWWPCTPEVQIGWAFENGAFIAPEEVALPPPEVCTPAQGLVALYVLKRITEDNVLQAINSIPDDELRYTARIGYQRATSWERTSPTMQTMAQLLQLSESDLDELFTHAAGVNL